MSNTSSLPSSVIIKQEQDNVLSLHVFSGHGSTSYTVIELDMDNVDRQENSSSSYYDDSTLEEKDDDVEVSMVWPGEFYTIDIVAGFLAIDKRMSLGEIIEAAFSSHFSGVCYVKTTYNDHHQCWQHAMQQSKDWQPVTPAKVFGLCL
jgi:hypothetical protein